MYKIIILFIILAFLPLASAQELSFYKSEALISPDKVKFSDTILVPQELEELSLDLFFKIENFEEETTFVDYKCEALDTNFGSRIHCDLTKENVSGRISLSYETENLVEKIDGKFIYRNDFKVPLKTDKLLITNKLEEGLILISEENDLGLKQFLPVNGTKGSDGRRIYIIWEKQDVESGDGISTNVVFESLQKPEPKEIDSGIFVILGVLVVIIALLVVGILFYKKSHTGMKPAIQVLKDDERKVVEILQNRQGQAKQRDIQADGDFSKATLSRLIKNLEERGVITTERMGRTNKIYLKKELGKKEPEKQKETEKSLSENQNTENKN